MPPAEYSEDVIRREFEYFVRTSRGDCLHLLSPDASPENPEPLCGYPHGQRHVEWVSKPVEVYPPGFYPICSTCQRWLQHQDTEVL